MINKHSLNCPTKQADKIADRQRKELIDKMPLPFVRRLTRKKKSVGITRGVNVISFTRLMVD